MPRNKRSVRRSIAFAVLLLLVVLAVGYLAFPDASLEEPSSQEAHEWADVSAPGASGAESRPRPESQGQESSPPRDAQARRSQAHSPPSRDQEPETASDASDASDKVVLRLEMVDQQGSPMPLVPFEYVLKEDRSSSQSTPRTGYTEDRTDIEGAWTATGHKFGLLWIRILDPTLSCVPPSHRDAPMGWRQEASNIAAFGLKGAAEQTLRLELRRKGGLAVTVTYADGKPYVGKIGLGQWTDAERRQWQSFDYRPGMTLPVADGMRVALNVRSVRSGFHPGMVVKPTRQEVESGHIEIVIPEDPNRLAPGKLVLDHWSLEADQSMVAVLLGSRGSHAGPRYLLSGPGETRTDYVSAEIDYTCLAVGKSGVWSSGQFRLEEGEERRIKVSPQPPAQLTLAVQDTAGQPIENAMITAVEVGRASWGTLDAPPDTAPDSPTTGNIGYYTKRMTRGESNATGAIHLQKCLPGIQEFYVEAEGYESERISVDLRPGTTTDHGTVTLARATGSLVIRATVPDGKTGSDFRVWLYDKAVSVFRRPSQLTEDGTLVLENVRAGRFQVFINPHPNGGTGWYRMVSVDGGEELEVQFDLTAEPGLQE